MQNSSKVSYGEKIFEFIQRNRKGIFFTLGLICVLIAGSVIFLSLQESFRKKAILEAEELSRRYNELRYFINNEDRAAEVETLLLDAETFAENKREYAAGRAWFIAAQIYSAKEDWQKAEETWLKAAHAGNKTYLAPIAFFNAAAAAEEQGRVEQAIEYLQKCVDHPFEFPAAPRAQFNIGRLYEQQNNYSAAIEAYRAVLINWQDTTWNNLARSAIINIEVR